MSPMRSYVEFVTNSVPVRSKRRHGPSMTACLWLIALALIVFGIRMV